MNKEKLPPAIQLPRLVAVVLLLGSPSACNSAVEQCDCVSGMGGASGAGGSTATTAVAASTTGSGTASSTEATSGPAGGGGSGQASAGGGSAAWYCEPGDFEDRPECCTVPDHMPCKGFSEVECSSTDYCVRLEGIPWDQNFGDPGVVPLFVGCRSTCLGVEAPAENCGYHPSDPQTCFKIKGGWLPDGWTEVFECSVSPGLCGTPP